MEKQMIMVNFLLINIHQEKSYIAWYLKNFVAVFKFQSTTACAEQGWGVKKIIPGTQASRGL